MAGRGERASYSAIVRTLREEPSYHRLATKEDVRMYLEKRRCMKYFFGKPLPVALDAGYQALTSGLSSICDYRVTKKEAETFISLKPSQEKSSEPFVSLFEGSGNLSYSFATAGDIQVVGIDNDPQTVRNANSNLRQAGVQDRAVCLQMECEDFLTNAAASNLSFSGIFIDPPWPLAIEDHENVTVDEVSPYFSRLVKSAVDLAPIVIMRLPRNIALESVQQLAKEVNRGTVVAYLQVVGEHDEKDRVSFETATVFLVKDKEEFAVRKFTLIDRKDQEGVWEELC